MVRQKLRGLVGQGVDGKKSYSSAIPTVVGLIDATSGSGAITAPRPCTALVYAYGGGGSGASGGNPGGGGGGGALFKRVRLALGQRISFVVGAGGAPCASDADGNSGTATVVTLPSGQVVSATGGFGGTTTGAGVGGSGIGGDVNRVGGDGGRASAGTSTVGGGAGGASGGAAGGGGGAGFSDSGAALVGGNGGNGSFAASSPGQQGGGGSGSAGPGSVSGIGGQGRVVIQLLRIRA